MDQRNLGTPRMKMDRKLLSSELHEIRYMARKLKVPQKLIRLARAEVGRGRRAVTAFVKDHLAKGNAE